MLLGYTGHNPLIRFTGYGGGVEMYGRVPPLTSSAGALAALVVALSLSFHVALPFVLHSKNLDRRLAPGLLGFVLPFVVGLLLFSATYYNMRYFIPLFPFVAILAVHGFRRWPSRRRLALGVAYVLVAFLLVWSFNTRTGYRALAVRVPHV